MNVLRWLDGCFTNRGKALSLYRQGMAKAKQHDHQGALVDYGKTIDMAAAPSDVRAMALLNRALVYVAAGSEQHGLNDLRTVLGMSGAPESVKASARRKLAKIDSRREKPHA